MTEESVTSLLPHNYSNQDIPFYILRDNTTNNIITDAGATLGRVLFYDKRLSKDNTVSCASCHQQELAFSDSAVVSTGVNGPTARHSMRLVNGRFSEEVRFFWDKRADSLEEQTTQPIRDHAEMGFSGSNGDPEFTALLEKLSTTPYYDSLFVDAFANNVITEERMQSALAQFIRSIQSFDSRYDQGRANTNNDQAAFANFTSEENEGKRLFLARPDFNNESQRIAGTGLGCQACHRAPEFDIDPNTRNNGVISVAENPVATDTTNTRSPTLRDLFSSTGQSNGPFMHDGSLATFSDVLDHYNNITADNNNRGLDNRLRGSMRQGNIQGTGQNLLLTQSERSALTAFIKTLSGTTVYTDEKWSNPFDENGSLVLRR